MGEGAGILEEKAVPNKPLFGKGTIAVGSFLCSCAVSDKKSTAENALTLIFENLSVPDIKRYKSVSDNYVYGNGKQAFVSIHNKNSF